MAETDTRQSRCTKEEIFAVPIEQQRGTKTAELCRKHEIKPDLILGKE